VQIGIVGYLFSGAAFLAMALLLLTSWKGRLLGGLLVLAVLANVIWSGLLAYELYTQPYDFGQNAFIEW